MTKLLLRSCLFLILSGSSALSETPLTRCIDVHALDPDTASKNLPARITGIITFASPGTRAGFIIQDETRGIFVTRNKTPGTPGTDFETELQSGMEIELTGTTLPGHFAPIIDASTIRVLGNAPPPPAIPVTLSDLLNGTFDCQRVRIEGVVQRASSEKWFEFPGYISLATPQGRVPVIPLVPIADRAHLLVDAEVSIEGVCVAFFNIRRELTGVRIQLQNPNDITILKPAPPDPFAVPSVEIKNLRPFSLDPHSLHRKQLRGTVTVGRPGEFFYIQKDGRGIRVKTTEQSQPESGTEIAVSGFIDLSKHYAEITEATFRAIGVGETVKPIPLTWQEVLGKFTGYLNVDAEDVDGRLATISGKLIQIEKLKTLTRLYLETEETVIPVELPPTDTAMLGERLRIGSTLAVTGVCVISLNTTWPAQNIPQITGMSLIAASENDIRVTALASWWTPERLWKALAAAFGTLLLVFTWALFLKRRADHEKRSRENDIVEFNATIRERERLAADLHDTLEQALTGVAFQLETMHRLRGEIPERCQRNLRLARQMLAGSREDIRRSVWNLRANILEGRMLREALGLVAEGLAEGRDIRITTGGEGKERPLPELVAGNLLMLAKEAVTNALKHSHATAISLSVDYTASGVSLEIRDNGLGFDPGLAAGPNQGHFGLQGMRERARRLGGTLDISSRPGEGTRVSINVPL